MSNSRSSNPGPGDRPDPDALLRRVNAESARASRAKLKIFFGFAPGVGKTYAMLESAQRLHAQGVDVLVGAIETHGRSETAALCKGLTMLPRRTIEHRGAVLEEFDLDGALVRHPKVLLLDELAHSNAPGARHGKRYQDVLDLLEAGIDVHTTLNVQHIESLNDVIAQVTQVRVRETVPDAILDRADEIELVDLPPEELLTRLREGKVYLGEQAARAAQNFFQRGNLLALRELALRRTADRVDAEMVAYRSEHDISETWAAGERILVCVGPSPGSASLVRAARRMAAGLRAPWVAAYVEHATMAPLSGADQERLEGHLRLAESLGGTVVRLTGGTVSEALLEHARKHNVTRILLGKPTHNRLRDRLRGSLLDEVVRGSGDIDVLVISGGQLATTSAAAEPQLVTPTERRGFFWSLGAVAVATVISWLLRSILATPDLVMIYLLSIMVVAARLGRGPSILAAAISVAAYDFFFVAPQFTFAVSDARHVLTFLMMFAVGILISALTLRIRRQEESARRREERTSMLYALSRELGTALDEAQVASVLTRHAAGLFGSGVTIVVTRADRSLSKLATSGDVPWGPTEDGAVSWVLEHGRSAGRGTDTLPGATVTCVPLSTGPRVLGVLALVPSTRTGFGFDERGFLEAFARQGALALERAQLAEDAKSAALRARTEEMRSSLLSAVSHDLRTPLAVITGAASSLREDNPNVSPSQRAELLDTLTEEAERMERLVSNLLDMTRLESGGLALKREWVPVEEMVGSALNRLEDKLELRRLKITLPADLPLVPVDPVLFEQVFVNLLENAGKYTPANTTIEVRARVLNDAVEVEVADNGPGLSAGAEEKVFDKFYRGNHVGVSGVGLGLAICRGIVEAHGGTISAHNRSQGGAAFVVLLPLAGQRAPAISREPEPPSGPEESSP